MTNLGPGRRDVKLRTHAFSARVIVDCEKADLVLSAVSLRQLLRMQDNRYSLGKRDDGNQPAPIGANGALMAGQRKRYQSQEWKKAAVSAVLCLWGEAVSWVR